MHWKSKTMYLTVLFCERARQEHPQSITAAVEVRNTLDLEREETAWNYVRRYSAQEIKKET
ncbi:hypothetical protein MUP01_09125 [Candidatus Bathyarchaeota archaeon]|nr:hypothetical protein [Candidatus Bathyarchaeota archaeon]